MAIQNKKNETNQSKFKTKDNDPPSKFLSAVRNRGIPGQLVTWKPSPDEEYEFFMQLLSENERTHCITAAAKSLKERGFTPDSVSADVFNRVFEEEVMCHLLQLAIREPELTRGGNRRICFKSAGEIKEQFTTDRITQLYQFYVTTLERDSPSMHLLTEVKDFDAFVKEIADGEYSFLYVFSSVALVEIIYLMAQHCMSPTQQLSYQNSSEWNVHQSSMRDNGLSTESQSTPITEETSQPKKRKERKPVEVKPLTEKEAQELSKKIR